ncbi:hypothetical protein RE428_24550 [Marinobacter nanhaiticus D15-8W]|nr:hypothetical protein RE428_24550 [Marinobacter nanhaiticus D15-8W]
MGKVTSSDRFFIWGQVTHNYAFAGRPIDHLSIIEGLPNPDPLPGDLFPIVRLNRLDRRWWLSLEA